MSDIRINALATTAASTASDDYLAVDGSANGTRKLSAYSPTFGGNLTVSGTGTSSFAGPIALTYGSNLSTSSVGIFATVGGGLYLNAPTGKNIRIGFTLSDRVTIDENTTTLANNLTVAGTGTNSIDSAATNGRILTIGTASQSGGNFPYVSVKTASAFSDFALAVENPNTTAGQGLGLRIVAGSASNDLPLYVRNQANSSTLFSVGGTGNATLAGTLNVAGTGTSAISGSISIAGQASSISNSTLVMDYVTGGDYGRLLAKNSAGTYATAIQTVNPLTVGGALTATGNLDRKSTRLNSSHVSESRMPSSA